MSRDIRELRLTKAPHAGGNGIIKFRRQQNSRWMINTGVCSKTVLFQPRLREICWF
ncbi:MAG: hypothetical protein ACLRVS_02085 [Lachnospiraceae bacterium]